MTQTSIGASAMGGARALRLMPSLRLVFVALCKLPGLLAAPVELGLVTMFEEERPMPPDNPTLWIYLGVAVGLVLLGGAFAGLTIALMGQDEIYLEVIRTSGDGSEQKHAANVLKLLKRGKHWVLVTLLLGNVITNETLPIVLDRSLGGGWPAVLGSTVAIVIFGEIIPQSICVRYGLPIGAYLSPLVLGLMYLFFPVAWPTAKLLDWLLGEDHGTTYKKAGLKTLVTLHKTLGAAGEQLNQDEVTIISAVLDLKEKPVGSIMTPMKDVFTMSEDTVLDEKTTGVILHAGYSRIPIYAPGEPTNFVGMLLVKILIPYDPEDCKQVKDFSLATLPETYPNTSCLDIVNYFQEGKSHMMLVSKHPGKNYGALGVVTLEDVMEELIGEEIIDETDNAANVSKALRQPDNHYQSYQGRIITDPADNAATADENLIDLGNDQKEKPEAVRGYTSTDAALYPKAKFGSADLSSSPKPSALAVRRTSSIAGASDKGEISRRGENPERRERFKHIGPMNPASRPRQTRYNTVKIKSGAGTMGDLGKKKEDIGPTAKRLSISQSISQDAQSGVGEGLLSSAGKDAKDGVHAVQTYGTIGNLSRSPTSPMSPKSPESKSKSIEVKINTNGGFREANARFGDDEDSNSTISSLREQVRLSPRKRAVRSGSITENIIDAGGIKKVVISLSSSSSETDKLANGKPAEGSDDEDEGKENSKPDGAKSGRKKRRRRRRKGGPKDDAKGEDTPLMDGKD